MTEPTFDAIDSELARAVLYRTLSIAFQPPIEERLEHIGAHDGFPLVTGALRLLSSYEPQTDRLEHAARLLLECAVPSTEATEATYWRLFGHTTRGPICACETEYGPDNGFHQPQQLADIHGYYLAFGLHAAAYSDLRADHIACECEFMDFLHRKTALLMGDRRSEAHTVETREATRQAGRTFLRDHLGRFGRAFGTRLVAADPHGYFGALGQVLAAFLENECAHAGVPAGPADLALRPDDIDDAPMACGSRDELIQIQRRP